MPSEAPPLRRSVADLGEGGQPLSHIFTAKERRAARVVTRQWRLFRARRTINRGLTFGRPMEFGMAALAVHQFQALKRRSTANMVGGPMFPQQEQTSPGRRFSSKEALLRAFAE